MGAVDHQQRRRLHAIFWQRRLPNGVLHDFVAYFVSHSVAYPTDFGDAVAAGVPAPIRRLKGRGNHGQDAMPCVVLSGCVVLLMAFVDFKLLHRFSYFLLIAALVVLAVLLVIGSGPNVSRWVSIGGASFSPLNQLKLPLFWRWPDILTVCRKTECSHCCLFSGTSHHCCAISTVMKQPDLGTALMLLLGGLSVIFAAGLPWRYVGGATVLALGALPLLWMQLHDYQKSRVMTFLNPEADVLGLATRLSSRRLRWGLVVCLAKGF